MFTKRIITVLCAIILPYPKGIFNQELKEFPLVNYENKSYYFGEIFKGTYFQAEQFCRYNNMQLLSITSQGENNFLQWRIIERGLAEDRFWTSGTLLPDKKHWVWMSTGRRFVYTNWLDGEPNYAKNYEEQCVEVKVVNGILGWNDANCTRLLNFVCEISWLPT